MDTHVEPRYALRKRRREDEGALQDESGATKRVRTSDGCDGDDGEGKRSGGKKSKTMTADGAPDDNAATSSKKAKMTMEDGGPDLDTKNSGKKRAADDAELDEDIEERTKKRALDVLDTCHPSTAEPPDPDSWPMKNFEFLQRPNERPWCQQATKTPDETAMITAQDAIASQAQEPPPAKTPAPKDFFPFLELPAELRLHVYRMAFQRDEPLLLHVDPPNDKINERDAYLFPPPRVTTSSDPTTTPSPIPPSPNLPAALLRTSKLIYKESRQVLYAENAFTLLLPTGIPSLLQLHQRSRSQIHRITLAVPSHHDILDGFADLVRMGLRYCWHLRKFTIVLDGVIPDDRWVTSGTTSVYATAFHILRFLPRGCEVALQGEVSEGVRRVVEMEAGLLKSLDKASHLRRQHQMPDRRGA